MQRYNLVYRPRDPAVAAQCVAYAQNFAAIAAGYLLNGVDALPHVTLCQFYAESDELAPLWDTIAQILPPSLMLSFDQFYVSDYSDGHLWVGFSVKRDSSLIRFQTHAVETLSAPGSRTILTAVGDAYFPHLTLTRIVLEQAIEAPAFAQLRWLENFYGHQSPFSLSLGLSDENGVFMREIFPGSGSATILD